MREDLKLLLQAQVICDGRVRTIRHSKEPWASEEGNSLPTFISYLRETASAYEVSGTGLASLIPAAHMAGCGSMWYSATVGRNRPPTG